MLEDFSILFDKNPDPMWIYDISSLRILKVNEAAVEHYGYSEKEFLTMTIRDLRPKAEVNKLNDHLLKKSLSQTKFHGFINEGIWKHLKKNGEIIYAEISRSELTYNNINCWISIANDVTEKLSIKNEVKRTTERLDTFIESITDAFFVIDKGWKFIRVNKAFEKITGKDREAVLGSIIWDVFPSLVATKFEKEYRKAAKNKISIQFAEYIKPMNMWFETTVYPSAEGMAVFLRDVTYEKQAHEKALLTQRNLQAVINNTTDLIWSIDQKGRYVNMNNAYKEKIKSVLGVYPKVGEDAYKHSGNTNDIIERWKDLYNRAFSGKRHIVRHTSTNPHSKEVSHFEISFNPIYKTKDEIIGVGCFAHDITERLNTEKAIINQNQRLRDIASLSSHELRRPVTSMIGLINLIDQSNFSNPENLPIIQHLYTVSNEIDEVIRLIVNQTFIDKLPDASKLDS